MLTDYGHKILTEYYFKKVCKQNIFVSESQRGVKAKSMAGECTDNQSHLKPKETENESEGLGNKIRDFFYFNDFYIFALIFIILLGYLVYRGL